MPGFFDVILNYIEAYNLHSTAFAPTIAASPEETLIKDHERAYFDSADWALGKQGVDKPRGPLEALRPKLQPTQQQTRYRKSLCAPNDGQGDQ
uniref:Putative endosulphine n=1 Tax=Helianthus annuus TaxID=4232 RepID=A0A251UMJ9_HELAN